MFCMYSSTTVMMNNITRLCRLTVNGKKNLELTLRSSQICFKLTSCHLHGLPSWVTVKSMALATNPHRRSFFFKWNSENAVNTSSTPVHNLSMRTNVAEECQLPRTTVLTQSPSSTKTGDSVSSWAASRTGCCCEPYWVSGPHLYGHVCISVSMRLLVISVRCGHLNRGICWRGFTWQQLTRNVASGVPESHEQFLHYAFCHTTSDTQGLIAANAWTHGF